MHSRYSFVEGASALRWPFASARPGSNRFGSECSFDSRGLCVLGQNDLLFAKLALNDASHTVDIFFNIFQSRVILLPEVFRMQVELLVPFAVGFALDVFC